MRDKIRQFMYGRNGLDKLGIAMLIASVILNLLSSIRVIAFLRIISLILLALVIFRMLSRDLTRRGAENARYLQKTQQLRQRFSGFSSRVSQAKDYKFFNCPGCKNCLRVPRGKGKIHVTCPRCGQRFSARS